MVTVQLYRLRVYSCWTSRRIDSLDQLPPCMSSSSLLCHSPLSYIYYSSHLVQLLSLKDHIHHHIWCISLVWSSYLVQLHGLKDHIHHHIWCNSMIWKITSIIIFGATPWSERSHPSSHLVQLHGLKDHIHHHI
jgi:hypothetical protein